MLIPRFTIRGILIAMIGCGFLFLVLADAVRGRAWALAIWIALAGLAILALLFVACFLLSAATAQLFGIRGRAAARQGSPFASAGPPPQVIPPEEPVE